MMEQAEKFSVSPLDLYHIRSPSTTQSNAVLANLQKKPFEDTMVTSIFFLLLHTVFNSLPNKKFLDSSKLKAFADDKLNLAKKLKFGLGRVENILGKGEDAGYQHFLLFPQCFQKTSTLGSLKVGIVW